MCVRGPGKYGLIAIAAVMVCVLVGSCGGGPGVLSSGGTKIGDVAGTFGGDLKGPLPSQGGQPADQTTKKGQGGKGKGDAGLVLDGVALGGSVLQDKSKWYRSEMPAGSLCVVTLQPLEADEDSDLYVYTPSQQSLIGSSTRGHEGTNLATPDWVAFTTDSAGQYEIQVYGYSPTEKRDKNDFTIEADTVATLEVNGAEQSGAVNAGESDWHGFTPAAGVEHTVTLVSTAGDADLFVYGSASDQLVGQSTNAGGSDAVTFVAGPSSDCHVRVYGASNAEYRISVTRQPTTPTLYLFDHKWGGYGQFDTPYGLCLGPDGNVYVADLADRVQVFTPAGQLVRTFGEPGSGDGQLRDPLGVAVDRFGCAYVTDSANDRVQKFDGTGAFVTKWGSSGSGAGEFDQPWDVAVGPDDYVYVTDNDMHRVQKFTPTGQFLASWGTEGSGAGQLYYPTGIAVDAAGYVYVVERDNFRVQKFTSSGDPVLMWGSWGSGESQFQYPFGVAVDAQGYVYVADWGNHRVQKFSNTGDFITEFGEQGTGDGQFRWVSGVDLDQNGYVFVSDLYNHRVQVFRPVLP